MGIDPDTAERADSITVFCQKLDHSIDGSELFYTFGPLEFFGDFLLVSRRKEAAAEYVVQRDHDPG